MIKIVVIPLISSLSIARLKYLTRYSLTIHLFNHEYDSNLPQFTVQGNAMLFNTWCIYRLLLHPQTNRLQSFPWNSEKKGQKTKSYGYVDDVTFSNTCPWRDEELVLISELNLHIYLIIQGTFRLGDYSFRRYIYRTTCTWLESNRFFFLPILTTF